MKLPMYRGLPQGEYLTVLVCWAKQSVVLQRYLSEVEGVQTSLNLHLQCTSSGELLPVSSRQQTAVLMGSFCITRYQSADECNDEEHGAEQVRL